MSSSIDNIEQEEGEGQAEDFLKAIFSKLAGGFLELRFFPGPASVISLRNQIHYFATHCLDNGMDLNTVRLLLGHATLNMVLHYSQYVDVQKALVQHEQFSPLDGLYKGSSSMRDGWGWQG